MLKDIKYIDNEKEKGIDYDCRLIRKLYKKLQIPKEFYSALSAPIEKARWFVACSERSVGKTTGWLLWGLCMFWLYGTMTHYVRATEDEIAPKNSDDIFDVILSNNYIAILTDGEYNTVIYKRRRWYFAKSDEDGNIENVHSQCCVFMCSVDKAGNLKSSHNVPNGDLIIYDEFISVIPRLYCDFVPFCDFTKTIFRDRICGRIILLANTINREHQYFHELEIYDRITEMQTGDNFIHTTDIGTNIYVELVGAHNELRKKKKIFNQLYLGFKNPRLSAITGETTWAINNYPHIPECEYSIIIRNIYINHNNKLVNIEIVTNELGLCAYLHWSTKLHEDSIQLISQSPENRNQHFGIADDTKLGDLLRKIIKNRHIYFSSNDVGSFVNNYLKQCGILLPLL